MSKLQNIYIVSTGLGKNLACAVAYNKYHIPKAFCMHRNCFNCIANKNCLNKLITIEAKVKNTNEQIR